MREFMKLVEGLTEETKRQKSPEATPSATEYKDADAFDGPTIDLDSGASKGQLSAPSHAAPPAPTSRPGHVSRSGPAVSRVAPDAQSLNYLSSLMRNADLTDPEPVAPPAPAMTDTVEPVPPTPENLPAVISQAIMDTTAGDPTKPTFDPKWTMVRDLPGYMQQQIRALGRMVFAPFTDTPIEEINVIACPMLNSKTELDMMAHWIRRYGVRDDEAEMDFAGIMPGYAAQTQIWNAVGYTFMLVMDHAGGYVYSWPGGRGVHLGAAEERPLLRESECGQCEGSGTIEGGLSGDDEDEECPVCDGSGEIEDEEDSNDKWRDSLPEAAEPNDDAREANLEAAKDVFDAKDEADGTTLNEGVSTFKDDDGRWYVQVSRNGHIQDTHGPFAEDEVDEVAKSFGSMDNDPLAGDGSPWAGMNEAVEAPTRQDDLNHILSQVHTHDPLSNPWGIAFVEGDETMAAVAAMTEARQAPAAVEVAPEVLTEAQKFARLAGIGVKAKPRQQSPEAAALAAEMAALAGIRL